MYKFLTSIAVHFTNFFVPPKQNNATCIVVFLVALDYVMRSEVSSDWWT